MCGADRVGEAHRLTCLARPVPCGEIFIRDRFPRKAGNPGQPRRDWSDGGQCGTERIGNRIHCAAVKTVRSDKPPRRDALCRECIGEGIDLRRWTGDGDRLRRVHGGQVECGREQAADSLLRGADGEHCTRWLLLHEAAARGNQGKRVFEGQRSGNRGCDKFADAVAHHHGGCDAPGLPQTRQRITDGEDGGLGQFRLV